jgi:uncharacterized protein DUF2806
MSDTPSKDPLDNSVSVSASLEEGRLNVAAKSRFASAIDRLGGNIADLANPYLEGWSEQKRQKNVAAQALSEAELSAALKELESDPTHRQRALVRLLKDSGRKQENLDAVLVQTTEELKQLPPPTDNEVQDEREELDPDWMNVFEDHAVNASSEHLRILWARVLAGEIRKPASFSRTTLRFIAELDREIAELFQQKTQLVYDGRFIPKVEELEGQSLLDFSFLEEIGLVNGVSMPISENYKQSSDYYPIFNGRMMLRVTFNKNFYLPLISITRTGREIISILPKPPEDLVLRQIAKYLETAADRIELGEVVARDDDSYRARPIEVLYRREEKGR